MKGIEKIIKGIIFGFKIRQCVSLMHLSYFLFSVIFPTTVFAQVDYFKVEQGIPHLPVYENPAEISNPETGMLIFSHDDGKPLVYSGKLWIDLCSVKYEDNTSPEYFMVKGGIPYLPAKMTPSSTPLSGSVMYSQADMGLVVANGIEWIKVLNLHGTSFAENSNFSTDNDILTCRFPVLMADPLLAKEGDIYISIPYSCLRYHDGSEWLNMACKASVVTSPVINLITDTGTGGGIVVSKGGSPIKFVGICWGYTINPDTLLSTKTRLTITEGDGLGTFTSTLTGLMPNRKYYVRAYAVNNEGISYGENLTFTTSITIAGITTLDATNVTSMSAESGGDIWSNGGSPVTSRGIIWSLIGDPLYDQMALKSNDGSGVGIFPSNLTGLKGNTSYYVRAYAVNSVGTAYGNLVTVTTPAPVPPELNSYFNISNITGVSAVGMASIINDGGDLVIERGICLAIEGEDYIKYPSSSEIGLGIGDYLTLMEGLQPGTTYKAKAYATNIAGDGFSSETSFLTADTATILTVEPYNITQNTVQSGGIISYSGNTEISTFGICWSTTQKPTIGLMTKTTEELPGAGIMTYQHALTDLLPATTYYVRAYAINVVGVAYGNEYSFTTPEAIIPEVVTIEVNNITAATAVANGNVVNTGGLEVTERGICWNTNGDPTVSDNYQSEGVGVGSFSVQLTGLLPGTTYFAKAYAINNLGISYGNVLEFKTSILATVYTTQPSLVTSCTALSGGVITNNGGDEVIDRGVCWGTFRNPTLANNYTSDGSGNGIFESVIEGLSGSTKYYVRAYATNSAGVSYGNLDSLQTSAATVPLVITNGINSINGSTALVQGTIINNGGALITDRGICWSTSPFTTIDNNYVSGGLGNGAFTGMITGLEKGKTYYVRAYAVNNIGVAYGDELSFTAATLASIITEPVTSITGIKAVSGGTIQNDGGSTVTQSGVCWRTTENPTINDNHTVEGIGIGQFIHTMTGLMANTVYYVRAYAINSAGIVYGNQEQFISGSPEFAIIQTVTPKSGTNGVTIISGGTVVSNGGTKISSGGVCWSTVSGFLPDTVYTNKTIQSVTGSFASTIEKLIPNTKYYIRAYVVNEVGISYATNELMITTNSIPDVITKEPDYSTITNTSVLVGGTVISDGGSNVVQSGACWSTSKNPVIGSENFTSNGQGLGEFTTTITGLMGSTTYFVRAYAINAVGIAYGNEYSITTQPPTIATIVTNSVNLVSSTTARSGGTITSNGGAIVTTRGLVWSTTQNFATDTVVKNKTASTGYYIGSFSDLITNLKPNTVYFIRAYVENSIGIAYGQEVSFKTPVVPKLTTVYSYASSSTAGISGGSIASDGGASINSRGIVWSTVANFDPDTVIYNRTVNGTGTGSFVSKLTGLRGDRTYYVRAYATNIVGTGYGNLISFITPPPTLPALITREAFNIEGTTAISGGNILDNGGEPVTTRGVVWSKVSGFSPDTVVINKSSKTGTGIGYFSSNMNNLIPGQKYYFRAYAVNSVGIAYGNELSFTTLIVPSLTTLDITVSSTGTSASSGGVILSNGGTSIFNQGICWSTDHNPTISMYTKTSYDKLTGGNFQSIISNLKPVTTYYVRAYAINSQGVGYGNEVSFTSPPVLPEITTNIVVPVTKSSITTGGEVLSSGGAEITARGVIWSTNANFNPDTVIVNKSINGSGIGSFSTTITGIKMSITYYFRAYATNVAGTAYGNQVPFTIFPTAPVLTTVDISNIGGYTAVSGGVITSDGGDEVTLKGICWSTSTNPTIDDNRTYNGSGMDTYVGNLNGLTPNTLYYVRAYAINKNGVAYGLEKTFLTNAFPTLLATKQVTNIGATTATSGGEITDNGRTPIITQGICWSLNSNPTIDLMSKTVADGTPIGTGGFTANLSGMKPETVYYVRSYATNAVGTSYGSQVSFRTLAVMLPTVITTTPSAVDSIKAISGGEVLDDGGMPVSERGVCWSLNIDPTITSGSFKNDISGGLGIYVININGLLPGKKYYVRAFAKNTKGTAYGNLETFTTQAIRPTVNKAIISNLTLVKCDLSATVISDGGSPVTDKGIFWNTTGKAPTIPMTADNSVSLGAGDATINASISGLKDSTTYYVWAYATNMVGTRFSSTPTTFITPTIPSIVTIAPKSVTRNAAVCGGNVTYEGILPVTVRGVCYSMYGIPNSDSLRVIHTTGGLGVFSLNLINLKEGTKYYVRAFAINNRGVGYGNLDSLTTTTLPTVKTATADSVWFNGILTGGDVLSDGGVPVIERGVCWTSTGLPTIDLITKTKNGSGAGKFISTINGLTHATTYYIRAYATNSLGTAYGKVDTVKTAPITPTLGKLVLEAVNDSTQVGKSEILNDGGAEVTACGLVWNNIGNPTLDDNFVVAETSVLGVFSGTITDLIEGPTYYIRAYATNAIGTVFGPEVSIKRCPVTFSVMHIEGLNGAPVTKTVTYNSVSSNISGKIACWLTQNLGANQQPTASKDATEASAGWYWQFNLPQGYKHDGTSRTPSNAWTPWITSITTSSNWTLANDPCNLLLGLGWRIPTSAEWTSADGPPQNWASLTDAYASELKLHSAGYLNTSGILTNRGSNGYYWSSTQNTSTSYGNNLYLSTSSLVDRMEKANAMPLRCIRDEIVLSKPSVSNVNIPKETITETSAIGVATVVSDGGAAVTKRGLCWNTIGNPTIDDNIIESGSGKGTIQEMLSNLEDGPTYYVRAYATNSEGTAYSAIVTSFKICPAVFEVIHVEGLNGAPVTKTVTYQSISSNITGKAACWLAQNLGADHQPTASKDASEASAGWYWQFNRSQGYKHDGTTRTPSNAWTPWVTSITENVSWTLANDPCNLLLGLGWRIPTMAEWISADAPPQNWTSLADAYASELKLHSAGYLNTGGILTYRGSNGYYWSSTQNSSTSYGNNLYLSTSSVVDRMEKANALPLRCIRDEIVLSKPSISNVTIPKETITETSAMGIATVVSDGGAVVTTRGLCWNTVGNPTISDNIIDSGSGKGTFQEMLSSLKDGPTYYVRAYATNSEGTAYSQIATSFKICSAAFEVMHVEGLNGAPVTKTVTYRSVSSNISGKAACWLTQNLGADQQPTASNDATEASAGWYWQFNRSQGYKHDGTTRIPSNAWTPWITSITESESWTLANDPCNLLLGMGWRIPTSSEWTSADAPPQNWTSLTDAYASELKLHSAGYLSTSGILTYRGSNGYYWSSTQNTSSSYGNNLYLSTSSVVDRMDKANALPLRCIRDGIVLSKPSVSNVTIPKETITENSAIGVATVVSDGGAVVTTRGLCWNTVGNPTISDNIIGSGSGKGTFQEMLSSLEDGPTYYVRAYATNSEGTAYSAKVASFKICPAMFEVTHAEGLNGAPVTKTVTYRSVSSNISGKAACWLTQNLGADQQPSALNDATEASAGWYWQFNRSQGYKHDGTTRTPSNAWTPWITSISESESWTLANDPCNLLLGLGWRIPTLTEWTAADAPPQNWTSVTDAYASELKLHSAGYLSNTGVLTNRGSYGFYWSSTQYSSSSYGNFLNLYNGSAVSYIEKANALPVRCIRESLVKSVPSVTDVVILNSTMTETTVDGVATVASDGGATITEKGFCWSTSGTPTISNNVIKASGGVGKFTLTLDNLDEAPTYYVRAYATNSVGTAYSAKVTSFKICPAVFEVIHTEGVGGAPVTKTVTYHSVSSNISGKAACWLTQNLGADQQASASNDATEATAGWYWQFNLSQGYKYDGSRNPSNAWTPWITSISTSSNWLPTNDPCNLLIGMGWRLPTSAEWTSADAPPQNWTSVTDAYASELKLHSAGYLSNTGVLTSRGSNGYYWSSTQYTSASYGNILNLTSGSVVSYTEKANALPIRCIRESISISTPTVSNITFPTSGMTETTALGSATVTIDGGSEVTERGICWSSTNTLPTISDNKLPLGNGTGEFTGTMINLSQTPTYYVRAYATNSTGTSYSPMVTSFKICPSEFQVIHTGGFNGAPVTKTVTYHSISSNISGKAACWLTQNLGADRQPLSESDNTESSSGWYWQFNLPQGYKYDGSRIPSNALTPWVTNISTSSNWLPANDPCNLLLGMGWRIPTLAEWTSADAPPQNWTSVANAYASELKLHSASYLNTSGVLTNRGSNGLYWSSTQYTSASYGNILNITSGSVISYTEKANALPIRCIRD